MHVVWCARCLCALADSNEEKKERSEASTRLAAARNRKRKRSVVDATGLSDPNAGEGSEAGAGSPASPEAPRLALVDSAPGDNEVCHREEVEDACGFCARRHEKCVEVIHIHSSVVGCANLYIGSRRFVPFCEPPGVFVCARS